MVPCYPSTIFVKTSDIQLEAATEKCFGGNYLASGRGGPESTVNKVERLFSFLTTKVVGRQRFEFQLPHGDHLPEVELHPRRRRWDRCGITTVVVAAPTHSSVPFARSALFARHRRRFPRKPAVVVIGLHTDRWSTRRNVVIPRTVSHLLGDHLFPLRVSRVGSLVW